MKQEELDHILKQHQLWLESNGEKGEFVNLRNANLLGADLQYTDLRRANLQGADVRYVNLRYANLRGADLRGADLRGANLRDADLRGTNLRGAYLRGAQFSINIRDCLVFHYAKFTSDALPWLILHPRWAKFKDTVQIFPS